MTTIDMMPLPTAVETVWFEFGETLRRFIQKRVTDPQAAEDILQDVFVKIHGGIGHLDDDSRLQAWVYQIARNAVVDYYRKPRLTEELPDELAAPEGDGGEAERQLARGLRAMVDALPEEYRQALVLTAFEGLTQKEAAERMGISLSGAKSRVQRGREKLRDMFFDCCHFEFDRLGRVIDYYPHERECRQCCKSVAEIQVADIREMREIKGNTGSRSAT